VILLLRFQQGGSLSEFHPVIGTLVGACQVSPDKFQDSMLKQTMTITFQILIYSAFIRTTPCHLIIQTFASKTAFL